MTQLANTLSELKASGWESVPVKEEIRRKLDEIVDFAGVERYLDTPVIWRTDLGASVSEVASDSALGRPATHRLR